MSAEAPLLSSFRAGDTTNESKTEKRSKVSRKQKMEKLELKSDESLPEEYFEIPPKENTVVKMISVFATGIRAANRERRLDENGEATLV